MIIIGQDKDIIVNFSRCSAILQEENEVVAMIERPRMGNRNLPNRKKSKRSI